MKQSRVSLNSRQFVVLINNCRFTIEFVSSASSAVVHKCKFVLIYTV